MSPAQLAFGPEFDSTPRHRLFFAIRPDAGAIDCLIKLTTRLAYDKIFPGRPVDADRLHVTDRVPPRGVGAVS